MRLGWCEPSMVLNRGQGVVLERGPQERGPVRTPWFQHIEKQHRNYVKTFVQELPGTRDAIVMVSDVDEIPNPAAVRQFTAGYPPPANAQRAAYCLEQRFHSGALNVLHPYQPWLGTTISRQRDMAPQLHRDLRTTAYNEIPEIELIPDGGWHLSWLGTDAERARKLETFSHAELRGKFDPVDGRRAGYHSNGERLRDISLEESYTMDWPRPLLDGTFKIPDSWFTDNAWEIA